jgi:hypothetical protein
MLNHSVSADDDESVSANGSVQLGTVPSLERSLLVGGIGFGFASLCVFATVAFGERWMYTHLGVPGAYLAWTLLFILLGGGLLGTLVVGTWHLPKFFILFSIAFLAYAVGWIAAYFTLRGTAGEWVGSLAGSIFMGTVIAIGFGAPRSALSMSIWLFVANSVGYFLGAALNDYIGGSTGMLLWGCAYGLCLGTGLGAVLHFAQVRGRTNR